MAVFLIQAFEFTHALNWLLIRDFLVDQSVAGISGSRDAELIVDRYGPVFQQLAGLMPIQAARVRCSVLRGNSPNIRR